MYKFMLWMQGVLVPRLGPAGLFVVAFLDSSFVSLPEINDLLVVTASAVHAETAWFPIGMATLGSLAGCFVLWWLGRRGGHGFLVRRFGQAQADRAQAVLQRWGILALAVPAVLPPPMPFKIFVFAAGVFNFPLRRFLITLAVARGLRYSFWGLMGVAYGNSALGALRAFDAWSAERMPLVLGAVVAVALVALGAYLWRRRRPGVGGPE
jgi:membrane protein YqaA with SNARE-associated domain